MPSSAQGGPGGRPVDDEGHFVPAHHLVPSVSDAGTTPAASPTTACGPAAINAHTADEDSGEINASRRNQGINNSDDKMTPPQRAVSIDIPGVSSATVAGHDDNEKDGDDNDDNRPLMEPGNDMVGNAPLPEFGDVEEERWLIWKVDQIIRVKVYFLAFHYAWIVGVSLIGGLAIWLIERDNKYMSARTSNFLDGWFNMASGVTCTGLFTKATSHYTPPSIIVWHIGVICGGTVFTSVVPPLLRIATLRLLRKLEESNGKMTRLRLEHIRKLLVTSTIMAIATMSYFVLFHVIGVAMYAANFDFGISLARTIATFNNSGFLLNPPDGFNEKFVNLAVLVVLVPAGSTLFPVYLRGWVHLMRIATTYAVYAKEHWSITREKQARAREVMDSNRRMTDEASLTTEGHDKRHDTSGAAVGDDEPFSLAREDTMLQNDSMLEAPENLTLFAFASDTSTRSRAWEAAMRHEYVRAFHFILNSSKPVNHHPWLFRPSDTLYIFIAWWFIVIFQTVPYFFQQWEGKDAVLEPQPNDFMKGFLGFTQTVCNRFSGIGLFDFNRLSDGQISTILFALYLPALPIPTERTSRKWKQMFSGGFHRLAGSRFFWLFIATLIIVFLEEGNRYNLPRKDDYGWNHGILIRTLFEVLSAYATSGLSVPLPSSVASLSSSFCWESKVVIMLCMFTGRHRSMDLGLDIGLTDAEKQARVDPEAAHRDRYADFDMASLQQRRQTLRDRTGIESTSPLASLRSRRRGTESNFNLASPTVSRNGPGFHGSTGARR